MPARPVGAPGSKASSFRGDIRLATQHRRLGSTGPNGNRKCRVPQLCVYLACRSSWLPVGTPRPGYGSYLGSSNACQTVALGPALHVRFAAAQCRGRWWLSSIGDLPGIIPDFFGRSSRSLRVVPARAPWLRCSSSNNAQYLWFLCLWRACSFDGFFSDRARLAEILI